MIGTERPAGRPRRRDPHRKERIARAALEVIAERGVAGTTHRRVAAAAAVPLGSMTYHFDSLDALLREAFTRLALDLSAVYAALLEQAATPRQAGEAVVEIICGDRIATRRNMRLLFELYAYSSRIPALQTIVQEWLERSRQALRRHFDEATVHALDALIEGLTIQNALDRRALGRAEVARIVGRVTPL